MVETYVIIDERGDSVDEKMNETMKFEAAKETPAEPREILFSVFDSLLHDGQPHRRPAAAP